MGLLSGEVIAIPSTDANGGLYAEKLRPSPMHARADGPGSGQAILHPFDPKFCDVMSQAVAATYIHTYIQYHIINPEFNEVGPPQQAATICSIYA